MEAETESGVSIKLVSLFESCPQQGHSSATSSTIYHFFFFTILLPFYRFSQNLLFPPYRQNTRNDLQNRSNLTKLGENAFLLFLLDKEPVSGIHVPV